MLVPVYEETAYAAGWWQYTNYPRIGHTPVYVMVFEFAVGCATGALVRRIDRKSINETLVAGVMLGASMPLAAFMAWAALGR